MGVIVKKSQNRRKGTQREKYSGGQKQDSAWKCVFNRLGENHITKNTQKGKKQMDSMLKELRSDGHEQPK